MTAPLFDPPLNDRPLVAKVTITAIGGDMRPCERAMTFVLDHQANTEVIESVTQMLVRRHTASEADS